MSHISCVHTLVNASGKKSNKVFFLPKLLLSFTSTRPEDCLDLRLKSGALVPTGNGIGFSVLDFHFCHRRRLYFFGRDPVKRRLRSQNAKEAPGPGPGARNSSSARSGSFPRVRLRRSGHLFSVAIAREKGAPRLRRFRLGRSQG